MSDKIIMKLATTGSNLNAKVYEYPAELSGGRNLLLDTFDLGKIQVYGSRGTITSKGNKSYTIIPQKGVNAGVMLLFNETLKSDTEYTLAFVVESNIATTLNYLDLRNNGSWTAIGNNRVRLSNHPIKAGLNNIKVTFKTGDATGANTLNSLWNAINSPDDLELTYSNLRLMEGNKATDWSPAPEDLGLSYPPEIANFTPSFSPERIILPEITETSSGLPTLSLSSSSLSNITEQDAL